MVSSGAADVVACDLTFLDQRISYLQTSMQELFVRDFVMIGGLCVSNHWSGTQLN